MRPRQYVRLQALATLLVSLAALIFLGQDGAATIAVALTAGAIAWLWIAIRYYVKLRGAGARSSERLALDGAMHVNFVLGLAIPLAIAWLVVFVKIADPVVREDLAVVVAPSAVLIPGSMLVSSSFDWYLIRAFREGVYGAPACRASSSEREAHLRYWVMHRLVSEFLVWAAIVVGIAFVSAIAESHTKSEAGKTMLNLVGLLGIIGWSVRELLKVAPAIDFVRYPSVGIADWATGRNADGDQIRGLVLDVALSPGVQFIDKPRGYNPTPRDISEAERCVPLSRRPTLKLLGGGPDPCLGACEFWMPDCEVGLLGRNADAEPANEGA